AIYPLSSYSAVSVALRADVARTRRRCGGDSCCMDVAGLQQIFETVLQVDAGAAAAPASTWTTVSKICCKPATSMQQLSPPQRRRVRATSARSATLTAEYEESG